MTADDIRDVTGQLLYAKQFWGILAVALAQADAGDGSLIRAIIDQVVSPPMDPSLDRFVAIAGSEQMWPRDVDAYLERGAREWVDSPHFWANFAYSELPFALWPARDTDAYDDFAVDPSPTPSSSAPRSTPQPPTRRPCGRSGNWATRAS